MENKAKEIKCEGCKEPFWSVNNESICDDCMNIMQGNEDENYALTDIKEECEKCKSLDTVTHVKRVYIETEIIDNGWSNSIDMPYLQYKQTCKKCGHEQIYHLQ